MQIWEQLTLTSISPSIGIMEASTSGGSCNQKDWQEKQKAKYDTWSQCRTMTPLDVDSLTKDSFKSLPSMSKS